MALDILNVTTWWQCGP